MGQNAIKSDFNKQKLSMKCNFIKKGLKYYTCKWREVSVNPKGNLTKHQE